MRCVRHAALIEVPGLAAVDLTDEDAAGIEVRGIGADPFPRAESEDIDRRAEDRLEGLRERAQGWGQAPHVVEGHGGALLEMLADPLEIGAPAALVVACGSLVAIGLGRQAPPVHGHLKALVAPDRGHAQKRVELVPREEIGITLARRFDMKRPLAEVGIEERLRRRRGNQLPKGENLIMHDIDRRSTDPRGLWPL